MIRVHLRAAVSGRVPPGIPLAVCPDRFVIDES
jgi:hypothetical protein